ncbi:MAG: TonB-dependent receptor, partial [Tannerellaceae bacterium]|nr:TonB-dependent receptor [Tannerellaceae bacterium]
MSGTVLDNFNEPVIGANVVEKGTTNGTITDVEGKFSLNIQPGKVLTVSYIGFLNRELTIGSDTNYHIHLAEDTHNLDEVVVVGFGTQKKVNLTGAISTVRMEDVLGDRPVVSATQALQGAMPGLMITTDVGKPGEAMKINIRGMNRLNLDESGEGSPLVLVDNVPMDINMLSPHDIETVTVLKDAASAAIYGARAAFGVILITTKQATRGQKVRINYNNNFAFTSPQSLIPKASPLESVLFYKDMGYVTGTYNGNDIDTWLDYLYDYQGNPDKYPLGYIYDDGRRYDLKETDHMKRLMDKSGFQQTHNVAVDGGTEKAAYRLSFGYLDEDGILITDKDRYRRYNMSSFVSTEVTQWLTAQADVKYANGKQTEPTLRSLRNWPNFRLAQLMPSYYPEGEIEFEGKMYPVATPRFNVENSPTREVNNEDIRIFGKAIVTPFKGMTLNAEYTFNRVNRSESSYNKVIQYLNPESAYFSLASTHGGTSSYELIEQKTDYSAINLYGNYVKSFGEHNISLMGGFNQEYSYRGLLKGTRQNVVNAEHPSLVGSSGTQTNSDEYDEYALRGLYYRVGYDYKGKYLLETNGRYDGSSKFPKGERFGFFPSVSAGWRISEESFMDFSKEYLTNLKVRASFGQVGNQAIKNYAFLGTMDTGNGWLANNQWNINYNMPGIFSGSFTWEKVETLDIGLDIGMFDNRLDIVFDWYRRDAKDMLAPGADLPGILGGDAPLENSADLRTKGWELAVSWQDRIGKDWRYSVGFNIYDSRTRVTKFENETNLLGSFNTTTATSTRYREGMEIGKIWGLVTDRYYTVDDFEYINEAERVYILKEGVPSLPSSYGTPRPGDILYKDLDKNGEIDPVGEGTADKPGDRVIIGNNSRRYPYSIHAGVGWKGFDVSLFFQGVGKRDIWLGTRPEADYLAWPHTDRDNAGNTIVLKHHLDYWTYDNPDAYYPRLSDVNGGNRGTSSYNRQVQSKYILDGSYIKLKNITVSYTFPREWLAKTKAINSLKVFFSGEDLWTKHHMYKGIDPEQTVDI